MNYEKKLCEQTTGITEKGDLIIYNNKGNKITLKEAEKEVDNGKEIEIPAAGAGSYIKVFKNLGFIEVKVIDWTSSAGDWNFGVKDRNGWRVAFQNNRYPYLGFKYCVNSEHFETFEDILNEENY
jgi:hypothetical protein